jgi:cytochrome c biogenesis protein CcmG/thiol:disulfide interchange protein DsbE
VRRLGACALLAALVVTGCARERSSEGRLAPTFTLPDVRKDRPVVALASYEGTPVVLNFFAAWCDPCRKEMPMLAEEAERQQGEVAFVGVDVQDSRSRATDLLAETGVEYPAAYDPKAAVAAGYKVYARLPATFFIDAEGRIVDEALGELSRARLRQGLRALGVRG